MSAVDPSNFKPSQVIAKEILDFPVSPATSLRLFDKVGHIDNLLVWLDRYLSGQAPEKLCDLIDTHLMECSHCEERWDTFSNRAMDLPPPSLPEDFLEQLKKLPEQERSKLHPNIRAELEGKKPQREAPITSNHTATIGFEQCLRDDIAACKENVHFKEAFNEMVLRTAYIEEFDNLVAALVAIHKKGASAQLTEAQSDAMRNPKWLVELIVKDIETLSTSVLDTSNVQRIDLDNTVKALKNNLIPKFTELAEALKRERGARRQGM